MVKPTLYLVSAVASLALLAACSGEVDDGQRSETKTPVQDNNGNLSSTRSTEQEPKAGVEAQEAPGSDGEIREIVITADDMMKFDPVEIEVKKGERIKLTLKNIGQIPKASMGHNLVVLKQGVEATSFVNASISHASNEYIAPDRESDVLVATKLLGPKESDSVVFNAPSEGGDYDYLCTFPGHYAAGMKGIMTVK